MAKLMRTIALATTLSVGLSGCFTADPNSDEEKLVMGTMLGAVLGGVAGYYIVGSYPVIGATLGFMAGGGAGYLVAEELTKYDRTAMKDTAYKSLTQAEVGETMSWGNNQSGNGGSITPVRSYTDGNGRLCREFEISLTTQDETREGKDIACQTVRGDWVIS